ncbi:MAG: insulinase family protein, partial [Bryobacter sp.]|nr:insulinase family protein [Bryobacter sp.]
MKTLLRWACALAPLALMGQDLADIQKRVTEFDLPNGLHFIIFERKVAPVAAFYTYVNAGAVNDPSGATGIAHMFEHMAFKGTPQIGTKNWAEEKKALDAVEKAYDALNAEKNKGPRAEKAKVEELEKGLKAAIDKANSFVESEVFTRVFEENGAQGMNAGTGLDQTFYHMSLPVNKAELWFLLESARLKEPVFREFYKERDVIR